jgi:4-amino-4-deoxy-L-arabinose transferase-like glycosyltransferase
MAHSILTAADTAAPSERTDDSMARTATGGWVRALGLVVAVGLVIRLVYTYVHGDNLAALGIDAGYYHNAANLLADGKWFVSPVGLFNFYGVGQAATHPPAYQVLLGIVSALGMRSVLFHQLWSCVIGGAAVALVGFTGLEVAGRRVGLLAAAIAAVIPTFWVNDALLMSESLVLAVVAFVLLLAYRFCRRPTLVSAAALGVATGIAVLTRAELVLLVPLLMIPLVVLAARPAWRQGVRLLVAAGLAALIVVTPWVVYNFTRFDEPVAISTGLGQTLLAANCPQTYFGPEIGYWAVDCVLSPKTPIRAVGDESVQEATYRRVGVDYATGHAGRLPFVVYARLGRTFGFYAPVDQLRVDERDNRRELPVSIAGLATFYVLAGLSIAGVVVLRRRRVPVFPVLAPVVAVVIAVAFTYGQTRFRAPAEISMALLAAVAIDAVLRRRAQPRV